VKILAEREKPKKNSGDEDAPVAGEEKPKKRAPKKK
jgi:hypothetical protein